MIGLIKKEIALIKSNFKLLTVLILFYVIMAFLGEMDISFILPFMSVMIMISTFSYDNYNKWDAYLSTLPNGRANGVKAKYIVTILMIGIVTIITSILSIVILYTKGENIYYIQIFYNMLGSIFGTLLVLDVMYPIIYKLGIEKARIAIFVIIIVLGIIGGIIINLINMENIAKSLSVLENYIGLIITLLSILFVYISYKISLKIQLNKEY